jgi:Na+-translocating ferredoxin:NAD+ oxidoreductase RnfD subunit
MWINVKVKNSGIFILFLKICQYKTCPLEFIFFLQCFQYMSYKMSDGRMANKVGMILKAVAMPY